MKFPVNQRAAIVLQILMGAVGETLDALDAGTKPCAQERHMRAGIRIYASEIAEEAGLSVPTELRLLVGGAEIARDLLAKISEQFAREMCDEQWPIAVTHDEPTEEQKAAREIPNLKVTLCGPDDRITDPARLLPPIPDRKAN